MRWEKYSVTDHLFLHIINLNCEWKQFKNVWNQIVLVAEILAYNIMQYPFNALQCYNVYNLIQSLNKL